MYHCVSILFHIMFDWCRWTARATLTIIQFVRSNAHIINDPTWLRWNVHDDGWAAYRGIQYIVRYKELRKDDRKWKDDFSIWVHQNFLNHKGNKLEMGNTELGKAFFLLFKIPHRKRVACLTYFSSSPSAQVFLMCLCVRRCRYRRHCIHDVRCDCFVNVKASLIQSHTYFSRQLTAICQCRCRKNHIGL